MHLGTSAGSLLDGCAEWFLRQETLAAFTPVIQRAAANPLKVSPAGVACACGLASGVEAFEREETSGRALKTLRKKYSALVSALCTFFLTLRTKSQLAELHDTLTQCEGRCDMSDPDVYFLHPVHDDGPHTPKNQMEPRLIGFVSASFCLFARLVEDLRPGTLESIYQEAITHSRSQAGRDRSAGSTGYEAMAAFLVPNADDTMEACYQ